jgi:peptidoglycan-associated lipoprotein
MSLRIVSAMLLAGVVGIGSAHAETPAKPTPQTAAKPTVPANLQKPRSQLQAEFAVAAGDTVLFPYQGKELSKRATKIVENQADWLKQHADLKISLEAYCDDDLPPDQTRALCQARAQTVKADLVRLGVSADRISILTFIDPPPRKGGGATAGGRKAEDKDRRGNRRVMTRIDS